MRKQQDLRRRGTPVGAACARQAVALAVQGMLTLTALCAGPAEAEPAARQTSSALVQASVPALKREYLRCDRESSQHRLAQQTVVYCSAISEELLKREFDGDLDLLLAWWREARQVPVPE